MTNYQKEIIAGASRVPPRRLLWTWISLLLNATILAGLIGCYTEYLPETLNPWLIFFAALLTAINWIAVPCIAFIWLAFALYEKLKVEGVPMRDIKKSDFTDFAKKTHVLALQTFSPRYVIDVIIDLGIFAILVITSHPVLALFFVVAVCLQHWLITKAKQCCYRQIMKLEDPLDDEDEDIDALMDKLTNSE